MSLPVRAIPVGRRRRIARASAGLSAARVLAAAAVLGSAAALYGTTTWEAFRLEAVDIVGTSLVDPTDVRQRIAGVVGERPNLFRIRTDDLEQVVGEAPPVLTADVRVVLPDRLVVSVTERRPILVWQQGERRVLADAEGVVFAELRSTDASSLPLVDDGRTGGEPPEIGDRLDPTDLAVVRQLGALTPAALGSGASRLRLAADDRDGWTLTAEPHGWRAVFGVYAARIRMPDLVPAQVQCLAAILATEEPRLSVVYLAPARDRCGTFRSRPED